VADFVANRFCAPARAIKRGVAPICPRARGIRVCQFAIRVPSRDGPCIHHSNGVAGAGQDGRRGGYVRRVEADQGRVGFFASRADLKPHRRTPDQPKTKIDVVYRPAEGRAAVAERVNRSIRLLETVAGHAADDFVWPAPFTLEMQSCGFPNARWDLPSHKLTLCYELAAELRGPLP
jgi:hypothetical protein